MPTQVHIVKTMVFPVVMYGCESDHKEGWVPKNWYFWTIALEKSLESPLEIKPVNPKGNQSWIFIGRTDVEAPILWPPDAKGWLTGKDPDAGKDWGQEETGMTGWDGWMASPTQWPWTWANSRRWWGTGKPGCSQVHEVAQSWTRLGDETTKTRVIAVSLLSFLILEMWVFYFLG